MDFASERYVRVYTRDTLTWKRLGWEGQATFVLLLRKVDRTGVLEIEDAEPGEAVSLLTGVPLDVAERSVELMLKAGVIERVGSSLVVPRFIEAQEAAMTTATRQQEYRLKRRDQIRSGLDPSQRETAIYFVQSEHGGEIKIGRADDVAKRLVGLGTGRPDKLVLLAAAPGTLAQERQLHELFAAARVKGEWFMPTADLMALVADVSARGAEAWAVLSQNVTRHEPLPVTAVVTGPEALPVTPYRTVPSHTFPNRAVPLAAPAVSSAEKVGRAWYGELVEKSDLELPSAAKSYEFFGRQSDEERAAVAANLRASSTHGALRARRALRPQRIADSLWHSHLLTDAEHAAQKASYAAGNPKRAAEQSEANQKASAAAKLVQLRKEFADRIKAAKAEGDDYEVAKLASERDQRLASLEAQAS
jgi:hypothetical protein